MIYTIVILGTGVYLNQEYPHIFPSIKLLLINSMEYLKTKALEKNTKTIIETIFDYFKK